MQALVAAYADSLPPAGAYPLHDEFTLIMMSFNRPVHVATQLQCVLQVSSLHQVLLIFNDNVSAVCAVRSAFGGCGVCSHMCSHSAPRSLSPLCSCGRAPHALLQLPTPTGEQPGATYESADIDAAVRSIIDGSNGRVVPVFPEANVVANRYTPNELIMTETVMWLDDDIQVVPAEVERAFQVALRHPTQLVGFYPRLVRQYPSEDGVLEWRYFVPELGVMGFTPKHATARGQYSMILPGGGTFANTRVMHMYHRMMSRDIFNFVRDENDCDDIAMNFMMANFTGMPPLYVLSTAHEMDKAVIKEDAGAYKGMSATKDHWPMRHKCLRLFMHVYKGNPLRYSDAQVAPFPNDVQWASTLLARELPTRPQYDPQAP